MNKIVIFGAGKYGRLANKTLDKNRVAYFVDNDPDKIGTIIDNKEVFPLEREYVSDKIVVIAALEPEAMQLQIKQLGVDYYVTFPDSMRSSVYNRIEPSILYTPTLFKKDSNTYFCVDCWHHRIIWIDNSIAPDIKKWNILDDKLQNPHSLATDGKHILVDNTDRKEILIYKRVDGKFVKDKGIQLPGRPHRIIYDGEEDAFYVVLYDSSDIAEIRINKEVQQVKVFSAKSFFSYCRSIYLYMGEIFMALDDGSIRKIEFDDENETIRVLETYQMPSDYYGLNDVCYYRGLWFVTNYTSKDGELRPAIICGKSLPSIENGDYIDITESLGFAGIPYFFEIIDCELFLTEIDTVSSVRKIKVEKDVISSEVVLGPYLPNDDDFYKRYVMEKR